jgi:hypothetical protein
MATLRMSESEYYRTDILLLVMLQVRDELIQLDAPVVELAGKA